MIQNTRHHNTAGRARVFEKEHGVSCWDRDVFVGVVGVVGVVCVGVCVEGVGVVVVAVVVMGGGGGGWCVCVGGGTRRSWHRIHGNDHRASNEATHD